MQYDAWHEKDECKSFFFFPPVSDVLHWQTCIKLIDHDWLFSLNTKTAECIMHVLALCLRRIPPIREYCRFTEAQGI